MLCFYSDFYFLIVDTLLLAFLFYIHQRLALITWRVLLHFYVFV